MAQNAKNKKTSIDDKEKQQTEIKKEEPKAQDFDMKQMMALMNSLQKQVNEQAELIRKYESEKQSSPEKIVRVEKKVLDKVPANTIKIEADEEITVSSCCDSELSLSTLGYGEGKVYTFPHIGYEIDIPYADLKDIIHNNRSFIEGGRVYIENEKVVQKFKLQDYYAGMLTPDEIIGLKDLDPKDFLDTLLHLPKAESNILNKGNEPHQIDIVLDYILNRCKEDKFPLSLTPQLERAYEELRGKKINIKEATDDYKNIVGNKG